MFVYQWIGIRMNKRIEELALECGAWNQVYDQKRFMVDGNFDIERFAELIVQECAKVADVADENKCEWIGGNILTHFGVEE
jgi:hypothetical protein